MYYRFAFIVILFIVFCRRSGADVAESGNSTASNTFAVVRHSGCWITTTAGYYVGPCQPQTTFRDATAERQRQLRQQLTTLLWIIYARQLRDSGSSGSDSDWGDWGPCSAQCGSGTRRRTKICGGRDICVSEETETCQSTCTEGWGTWTPQGACSSTCGDDRGLRRYTRQCGSESGCVGNNERYVWCTAGVECPLEETCPRKGGLFGSGKCYTIIPGPLNGVVEAAAACENEDALLAEIETSAQVTELLNFALETKPADAPITYELTLGMGYNTEDRVVTYREQVISYDQFTWTGTFGPGEPSTASASTHMYLVVTRGGSTTGVLGFRNGSTTRYTYGAVCENKP